MLIGHDALDKFDTPIEIGVGNLKAEANQKSKKAGYILSYEV